MKICLICVEIFAWGKYGGFGRSTRMLGREFTRLGHEVTAVVPRRHEQTPVEILDGIRVLGFEPGRPFSAFDLFKEADADIYHSEEPSFGTYLAQLAMPSKKHLVTFRDTRDTHDWWLEFMYPSLSNLQVLSNFIYEDNYFVGHAVRHADKCYATAKFLIPKAKRKYKLGKDPEFLPSPISIPEKVKKSNKPLVCFVGRFDRRKRPEIFLDLARKFPEVQFQAVGIGQDPEWDRNLKSSYKDLPNLAYSGFIDQFKSDSLTELLGECWVLVNTSIREGLPTSFLEAAANGCAILSEIDPDGFTSNYGALVKDGDFAAGLQDLLTDNKWAALGQQAREYVQSIYSLQESIKRHLQVYQELLSNE